MNLNDRNKDRERLIKEFVKNTVWFKPEPYIAEAYIAAAEAYLRKEAEIDILYSYNWKDSRGPYYAGGRERDMLENYMKTYKEEDFFRRCSVYMLFKQAAHFLRKSVFQKEGLKKLFTDFEIERVPVSMQVSAISLINDTLYTNESRENLLVEGGEIFSGYLKNKREETVEAFAKADAFGRFFGLRVLAQDRQQNKKEIFSYSQDSAKIVKEELLRILYEQKDWEEEIKELLASKKAADRELAIKVLTFWQQSGRDYKELLIQAFEKEKNARIKELLGNVLNVEEPKNLTIVPADLVKELHKGGKKRSLAWAYESPFPVVHTIDGNIAEEAYLQAILLCYASSDGCKISRNAAFLAKGLDEAEFSVYVNVLFDKWLEAGAESKKRWVLYASAIHGGSAIVEKLQQHIQEWPRFLRGAIACEAIRALSLNPLPEAFFFVEATAKKFKYRQVRAAANEALDFAAEQSGMSRDELADQFIPDFGFDENMEQIFDYGERQFKVSITETLEVEVFDKTGKKLKNLPAPGKKDDEEKAAAAYKEFKQMKKQIKATAASQKRRLEEALATAREWNKEAWEKIFTKNPVMRRFATSLIWGVYQDKKLLQSFRYMEDGSFNTEDEEEYTMPKLCRIGLVHPMELSKELKEAWQQQLEDYEITQPFAQLHRGIYTMTEEEADKQTLERFKGHIINALSLGSKLSSLNWNRGFVEEGYFDSYFREDVSAGLIAELHFSGCYIIEDKEKEVKILSVRFYKISDVSQRGIMNQDKACFLRDIPARYFSEIVLQLLSVV